MRNADPRASPPPATRGPKCFSDAPDESAEERPLPLPLLARSTTNKIPRLSNQSPACLREVVRGELVEFLACQRFHSVLRDQVASAFASAGVPPHAHMLERVERLLDKLEGAQLAPIAPGSADFDDLAARAAGESESERDGRKDTTRADSEKGGPDEEDSADLDSDRHRFSTDSDDFEKIVNGASNRFLSEWEPTVNSQSKNVVEKMRDDLYDWWGRLEEPRRTGRLARTLRSRSYDLFMCAVVISDISLMIYRADVAAEGFGKVCSSCVIGDWLFQSIYSIELAANLFVHHSWFFYNDNMAENWFDFALVVSGFTEIIIVHSNAGGLSLRILRVARFGKALRALKVMSKVKNLRAFFVCVKGSISPFFWALVAMASILLMFSIFFVTLAASALDGSSGMSDDMSAMFGSVLKSMLTLFMASLGGEDWAVAYEVISSVGLVGSLCYLFFIAFVQMALINIITGIFVEAAMQSLAPTPEVVAATRAEQEARHAHKLEHLCKIADCDCDGMFTREQFQEGMAKGRIPMLLTMLGLRREHVEELFREMSDLSKDDHGQVNIRRFVKCCMHLKGPATHYDIQKILLKLEAIQHNQFRHVKTTRQLAKNSTLRE